MKTLFVRGTSADFYRSQKFKIFDVTKRIEYVT